MIGTLWPQARGRHSRVACDFLVGSCLFLSLLHSLRGLAFEKRVIVDSSRVTCLVVSLDETELFTPYVRPCTTNACRSKGQSSSGGAAAHAGARAVHASLLRHLNRTAQQLPLLELETSNLVAPFRRAAA